MEQVYRFFEVCKKREIDASKQMAITMYNAIVCGSPSDNRKAAEEQKRHWRKFMKSLDWNHLMRIAESRANPDPLSAFRALGLTPEGIIKTHNEA